MKKEGKTHRPRPAAPKHGKSGAANAAEKNFDHYTEIGGGGKVSKGKGTTHHPRPFK